MSIQQTRTCMQNKAWNEIRAEDIDKRNRGARSGSALCHASHYNKIITFPALLLSLFLRVRSLRPNSISSHPKFPKRQDDSQNPAATTAANALSMTMLTINQCNLCHRFRMRSQHHAHLHRFQIFCITDTGSTTSGLRSRPFTLTSCSTRQGQAVRRPAPGR